MKKLKLTQIGSLDRHAGTTRCQERGGSIAWRISQRGKKHCRGGGPRYLHLNAQPGGKVNLSCVVFDLSLKCN